ncbi:hypothetical protein [Actinokineospora globicatena]|uniref:hypothetical protein n=1 Tax=Actinokineospora globicatena TaxID=103729 RepID=UPI002552B63D|nr:hypothetical protein [Actinokineospora globicatena]
MIFAVNAAVDGPVHVSVFDGEPDGPSGIHYFTASLPISARKIILHDPNEEVQLSFRRPLGDLTVTVFADSVEFPDFVEIYLGSV